MVSVRLTKGATVLWLILGIVLLVIAIAGGSVVQPVLFALGLLALLAFLTHWRSRGHAAL